MYRVFDYTAGYSIINSGYVIGYLPDTEENRQIIDISYNESILRNLIGYANQVLLFK